MRRLIDILLNRRGTTHPAEADVSGDPTVPSKRSSGAEDPTGDSDPAVGSEVGVDSGYAHETGAEARAEQE
ncbi:hypothetical protein [Sciscionella marina]|uniref:hypothetical protein n=1 Tax=Sciscionella marina TaxID=508770 RepID=UPI000372B644|nr:hypothetical protein [Sciscionella marina]